MILLIFAARWALSHAKWMEILARTILGVVRTDHSVSFERFSFAPVPRRFLSTPTASCLWDLAFHNADFSWRGSGLDCDSNFESTGLLLWFLGTYRLHRLLWVNCSLSLVSRLTLVPFKQFKQTAGRSGQSHAAFSGVYNLLNVPRQRLPFPLFTRDIYGLDP